MLGAIGGSPRVVVLHGPKDSCKTDICLYLCRHFVWRGAFSGGVFFVPVKDIVEEFTRRSGVKDADPATAAAARSTADTIEGIARGTTNFDGWCVESIRAVIHDVAPLGRLDDPSHIADQILESMRRPTADSLQSILLLRVKLCVCAGLLSCIHMNHEKPTCTVSIARLYDQLHKVAQCGSL